MPQLPVADILVMNEARVTASVSRFVQSSILAVKVLSKAIEKPASSPLISDDCAHTFSFESCIVFCCQPQV